jgi:anaerobic ribonucleoside-triphosphate reductase activating protein
VTDVRGAPAMLRVAHRAAPIEAALGPGRRAVIWVQGCASRCAGCIAPEAWDPAAGAGPASTSTQWAAPNLAGVPSEAGFRGRFEA